MAEPTSSLPPRITFAYTTESGAQGRAAGLEVGAVPVKKGLPSVATVDRELEWGDLAQLLAGWLARTRYAWPVVAGGTWFLLAFVGILWLWGGPAPTIFNSPDEATVRHASQLIAETGSPQLALPFEDTEDLAHVRVWVSTGDKAIPVLAPMTFFLYGAFLAIPLIGPYLVPALAALGAGSFAAAMAMLGKERPWIGLLAPVAAFPALYWLLRPWMNMGLFIALISTAFLCWALWRSERRPTFLASFGVLLAIAVAVRPDFAVITFSLAFLFTLAEAKPNERRVVLIALFSAGALSIFLIFVLNAATTGHPLTFGYEIQEKLALRAGYTPSRQNLPSPISELYFLFLPNGVPEAGEVTRQLHKYWLQMWPATLITLSFPVAMVLLFQGMGRRAWFYVAAVAMTLLFVVSRVGPDFFGAPLEIAQIHHSLPRYWAPVYLLAAMPLVIVAMSARKNHIWLPALLILVVLAVTGARHIYSDGGPESMTGLRFRISSAEQYIERLEEFIPSDAIIYSAFFDKQLWSKWQVGTIPRGQDLITSPEELERVASSVTKAVDTGRPVFINRRRQLSDEEFFDLRVLLAREDVSLSPVGPETLEIYAAR